jgi:hypothetical protein
MTAKTKTLSVETFEQLDPDKPGTGKMRRVWRVIKATDTTEFNPGEILLKAKVDELCSAREWKVTIAASSAR